MAEVIIDVRSSPKPQAYVEVNAAVDALLAGVNDEVTAMASMASVLHHGFGYLWTGFYRVVEPGRLLRVGPYQGTVGCLEIEFGRGVCGTAARDGRTIVVPDVQAFPGHIVCDARARSEIVVPVFNADGALIAVLDVDAEESARFDEDDVLGLEGLMAWFRLRPSPLAPQT